MFSLRQWKNLFCFLGLGGFFISAFADDSADPCAGSTALLALIDRPTVADSACVVPYNRAVLELGSQYEQLNPSGQQYNFPEAEYRVGLPFHTEFVFLPPNYIRQMHPSLSGYSAATVGIKHELGYNEHWLASVESLFTIPSGSDNFGTQAVEEAVSGIVTYTVTPAVSFSLMLGTSSETESKNNGGGHFTSVNPDLVFTWLPKAKLALYGEIYGQSKTAPDQGSGYNWDSGIIYLVRQNLAWDLEYGQRLSGNLDGFEHYLGTGLSLFF